MSVIDDRLKNMPPEQRQELEKIRQIVKQLVPDAEEVISYGMPGFKYKKKYLLGFEAFKDHLSLFPTAQPVEVFEKQLGHHKSSKGTIRFTLDDPLPESLIKAIVLERVSEIDGAS